MTDATYGNTWKRQLSDTGAFVRRPASFRQRISAAGDTPHPPEPDRYHLYISHACPWAHRTLITRALKGLEQVVTVDVVDHFLGEHGWTFHQQSADATADRVNGYTELRQAYLAACPDYDGAITVPVLWDKRANTIVNNESSEIIRMLDSELNDLAGNPELRLTPSELLPQIDELNNWIYADINNGVYRCGFARSQSAYDEAATALFSALDKVEAILQRSRYLTGPRFTEADVRLFTTLVRFDTVYHTHFKCNRRRIVDYPATWGFVRDVYQLPGVAETVNMRHIAAHYYQSHRHINPHGIVPIGPELNFAAPHGRESMTVA